MRRATRPACARTPLAYKARIVGAAKGDGDRFKAVYAEYQKAPGVTRDRMYIDAMKEVYANVTKVMVDTHGGNNCSSSCRSTS